MHVYIYICDHNIVISTRLKLLGEDGVGGGVGIKDTEYIILLDNSTGGDKTVAVNTVYHTSVRWLWIDPVTLYTYNTRGKDYYKGYLIPSLLEEFLTHMYIP